MYYISDQFLVFPLRKYSTSYFDYHKRRTMDRMIVMVVIVIMASSWGNSNAGIRIFRVVEYLIVFKNIYLYLHN